MACERGERDRATGLNADAVAGLHHCPFVRGTRPCPQNASLARSFRDESIDTDHTTVVVAQPDAAGNVATTNADRVMKLGENLGFTVAATTVDASVMMAVAKVFDASSRFPAASCPAKFNADDFG